MSIEALNWAMKQPVPNSSAKFVLVAIANRANPDQAGRVVAFTSVAYLAEVTAQDRKTVVSNLGKLREWKLIEDTGARVGRTKQVPVYEVKCPPDLFAEHAQKRNRSENGTVPKKAAKGTVFPRKGSQKRDPDSAFSPSFIPTARAGARGIHAQEEQSPGRHPAAREVLAKAKPRKLAGPEAVAAAVAEVGALMGRPRG